MSTPVVKIGIVHYNTPEITKQLVESIRKNVDNYEICVVDNSDTKPLDRGLVDFYYQNVIDFTGYTDLKYCSYRHAKSIQWMLDNFSSNMWLFDSDTYLVKDFSDIIDEKYNVIGSTEVTKYLGVRIVPYFCYLNLPEGVKFLDEERFYKISHDDCFDTGGSLYQDLQLHKISFKEINIYDYVIHYGGQSIRTCRKIIRWN